MVMDDAWVYILAASSFLFLPLPSLRVEIAEQQQEKSPAEPTFTPYHRPPPPHKRACPPDPPVPLRPLWLGPFPLLRLSFRCRHILPVRSQECFSRNDVLLANRPRMLAGEIIGYRNTTIGTAPFGPHWRNLRRLTALMILSPHHLPGSLAFWQEEVRLLTRSLYEVAAAARDGGFATVEMRSRLQELSFNIIMRMISGKRYFGAAVDAGDAEVARQFREVIEEIFELSGMDPGDFLPVLRKVVDFKGRERRMVDTAKSSGREGREAAAGKRWRARR